jgi:hypothetical protein
MNRWRVGEDRGSKETDRCPLTDIDLFLVVQDPLIHGSQGYDVT